MLLIEAINNQFIKHRWYDDSTISRVAERNTSFTGTTIYVDPTKADNTGDGLTPATAKKTIGAAYGAAANGGIIQLLDGTYDIENETGGYLLVNTSTKGVLIQGNANDNTAVVVRRTSAGSYIFRFRDCKECRLQNLTITNDQNGSCVENDSTYNRAIVIKNCVITNTNAGSSAYAVNLNCVKTETNTLHYELNGCTISSKNSNNCIRTGATGVNTTILVTNCSITHDSEVTWRTIDTNKGTIAIYNTTFVKGSSHVILQIGNDTTAPVEGVTGLVDIRNCTFSYTGTFRQHAILCGRGSDKVYLINNKVLIPSQNDVAAIGIVLKTTTTTVGQSLILGNYVEAPRPVLVKGGKNLTISYNSFVANYSTRYSLDFSNAKEVDAVDPEVTGNIVTYNNCIGIAGMIVLGSSTTVNSTKTSLLSSTIDYNKYYSVVDIYISETGVGNVSWANKATFWGNNNDLNSLIIHSSKIIV